MEKKKFQRLVGKYLSGKATAEEEEFVNRHLDNFQKNNETWNSSEMGEEPLVGSRLYQKTLQEIRSREEGTNIFKLRWLSAAAVVLILLAGVYYALRTEDALFASRTERFKNDVPPGAVKATLSLADGTRIVLDDKENGDLLSQGGVTISKAKDGQLVYKQAKTGAPLAGGSADAYNVISTPNGGKYMLILEDGTKIWLNSASSVRFPVTFAGNTRNVELTGEAYFEVAKNRQKPFIVRSRGTDVKVLGTHFNVSSYENESAVKATLLEGSVEVSRGPQKVLLKPGNQAGISSTGIKVIEKADPELVLAWKNGFFKFENAKLQTIMRELSRWYNVDFVYSADLPDEEFTGIVSQNVKISKVLEMLEQGGGVSFRIEGRKIVVTSLEK